MIDPDALTFDRPPRRPVLGARRKGPLMGLSLAECERLGIAHEHPDHPSRKDDAPNRAHVPKVDETSETAMKPSKYRNTPTTYNGVRYSSKAEAARAAQLDRMVKLGSVLWWVGQPRFRLGCPENVYVADFLVISGSGAHVEDVKGVRTAKFARDVKLWRAYGPCDLWVISGNKTETIRPESTQKQRD